MSFERRNLEIPGSDFFVAFFFIYVSLSGTIDRIYQDGRPRCMPVAAGTRFKKFHLKFIGIWDRGTHVDSDPMNNMIKLLTNLGLQYIKNHKW